MQLLQPNQPPIQRLFWRDVREAVASVEPGFAKIADQLDPGKDYPLYLANYPYGNLIVERGKCFYPLEDGQLVSIKDVRLPKNMRDDLAYAGTAIPAGIVLNNSIELFLKPKNWVMPWKLYTKGTIFALWGELDSVLSYHPTNIFNITAGMRSVFFIPSIGDIAFHKNLQRDLKIRMSPPKCLLDQWELFVAITRHPELQCDWSSTLLFFSGKWLEKLQSDDPAWAMLHRYLLNYAWNKSGYWRNQQFYDIALSLAQSNRNLKPNPYLVDTEKHLGAIALSAAPGFAPAIDESPGPIALLQKVYLEIYGLKKYAPTIMCPEHFSMNATTRRPIYYSLTHPTTFEFSPKSRKQSSTLRDLRELKHITEIFIEEIKAKKLLIENTAFSKIPNMVDFDFFHNKPDSYGEIRPTSDMAKEDTWLLHSLSPYKQKDFADAGTFVRGCVRISAKSKKND
jgi:hypothetical protein